jgi:hypothetical protein
MPTELENIVNDLLHRLHINHKHEHPIRTKYGAWKVDFYIPSTPPFVLSCKGLGERGLQQYAQSGTAKEMACIAFTEFYELKHNSDLPNDTCLILVYGDLPLKTREHNFPELFHESLGVHIFSKNEEEALARFILKCAPSLMPMAYLKMAKEAGEETKKAEKITSMLPQAKRLVDFAESSKHYAEILKKLSKELEDAIRKASPAELEKIIDMWLKTPKPRVPSPFETLG